MRYALNGSRTPLGRRSRAEASSSSRGTHRGPVDVEPARRLAARPRADLGAEGEKVARLVDAVVAWAVKDRELKHALLRT
ncbi:hypothetical protein PV367_23715 [Streptomyces europaeiscabiei]|uniref:Uncharacterized protein n=1 Tax=Streptomyces europaeiscabiei TaxID=146819 RepID=A0AAJ2PSV3_9ACTN|nr:hypothetical protein [Streptomyces europaeiscabiei]MDX3132714.1 hypothetical protein [Streptomyces europaeiscabiei]